MHTTSNALGHIIRILDEYTLVIDVGNRYVSNGDKIKVYQPLDDICSLDGTKLATYDHVKDILEVVDVEDNYSVCKKPAKKVQSPLSKLALSPLLEATETTRPKLNVDEASIKPLPEHDDIIRLGDPVKKA